MPSGGYRPGGGRPKGSKNVEVPSAPYSAGRKFSTALEFAMHVINDDGAGIADKIRLAIAAMPFQHAKLAEQAAGKKEQAQQAAETAGAGSEWGNDLAQPETAARLN